MYGSSSNLLTCAHSLHSAQIIEFGSTLGGGTSKVVGMISLGSHLSVHTRRGTVFKIYEGGTQRQLLKIAASGEAVQLVTIGHPASSVTIEFVSPPSAGRVVSIHKVWDDENDEHLVSRLYPGQALRVESFGGERWLVRDLADRLLLSTAASDSPFQRIFTSPPAQNDPHPAPVTLPNSSGKP